MSFFLKVISVLFFFSFSISVYSQEQAVEYYYGDNSIYNIVQIYDNIWCAGFLGLTRINKTQLDDKETITDLFVDYKTGLGCFNLDIEKDIHGNIYISDGIRLYLFENNVLQVIYESDYISDFVLDGDVIWILKEWSSEIVKIDGNTATVYNPQNSTLPEEYYSCIYAKNDIVWIGTYNNGIIRFDGNECESTTSENSDLPYNRISSIIVDELDNVWLSCHGEGVYSNYDQDYTLVKIKNDTVTKYNDSNSGLPHTYIYKLVSKEHSIYLCTFNGLVIFDGRDDWQVINKQNNGIVSDIVLSVIIDENNLWIGSNLGLSKVSNDSAENLEIATASITGAIEGPIIEDKNGNIWLGTSGSEGNLSRFDGDVWSILIQGSVNNPQSFYSLAVDSINTVWATSYSYSGGLYKLTEDKIILYNENNSPIPIFPMDVIVDCFNNKWIISDWSLIKFNDTIWKEYTSSDFPELKLMHSIASDSKGNIWIGVNQSGMLKFDGNEWTHYDDSFFGNEYSEVNNLFIDDQDNIWFDYSHGSIEPKLGKFDGSNLTFYSEDILLPEKGKGLLRIQEGNIWFGSIDGLAIYDWNKWIYYNSSTTRLLNNDIGELFLDSKNNIWLSSGCYFGKFNRDIYYNIHELEVIEKDHSFQLFPNPVSNKLTINSIREIESSLEIKIYDIRGKMIFKKNNCNIGNNNEQQIDFTDLKTGIYLVQITNRQFSETYKVVKK